MDNYDNYPVLISLYGYHDASVVRVAQGARHLLQDLGGVLGYVICIYIYIYA